MELKALMTIHNKQEQDKFILGLLLGTILGITTVIIFLMG